MCASCGCGGEAKTTLTNLATGTKVSLDDAQGHEGEHEHVLPDGTRVRHVHGHEHGHSHDHGHDHAGHDHGHHHHRDHGHAGHDHGRDHDHGGRDPAHDHVSGAHAHGRTVDLEARILAKNDARAERNRAWFAGREILALNLMSAPGAGKTTLLERTIRELGKDQQLFVIEGDQATANDGERIRAAGAPVVQVNTGTGCHLDADMIARGLDELKPPMGALVIIENVGNLVCPALFDLGETARVAILSVTEGDDKPIKYPHMFRAADLVLINKIDLLAHVDFSVERAIGYAREVNPRVEVLTVSARSGEGLADWYGWIAKRRARAVAEARV